MPRDPSGVYSQPFPDVVEGTTIESAVYNGYTHDVTIDLNTPRPISSGGTGASSAYDARNNLDAEVAGQVVTNYDSHVWENGSFYSAAGATGAPNAANRFAGICYGNADGSYSTLEARDQTTGILYVKNKVAGVWGTAWSSQDFELARQVVTNYDTHSFVAGSFYSAVAATGAPNATNRFAGIYYANADGSYGTVESRDQTTGKLYVRNKIAGTWDATWSAQDFVKITGDTMTGALQVNEIVASATATSSGSFRFGTSGSTKILSCDGNNFNIAGAGSFISHQPITARGAAITGSGEYRFGTTGGKALTCDGGIEVKLVNANFTVGPDASNQAIININGGTGGTNPGPVVRWQKGSTNKWYTGTYSTLFTGGQVDDFIFSTTGNLVRPLRLEFGTGTTVVGDGAGTIPSVGASLKVVCLGANTQYGIAIGVGADNATMISFHNAAGTQVGSIGANATNVAYNTSSGLELKEDLKSFDAGNIIDRTDVYDFAWKATGERSYGVIAQQAVEVYPTAVTHTVQGGGKADDLEFWGVDYSKYVPVLLQELKALRVRVAELEGKAGIDPKPTRVQ